MQQLLNRFLLLQPAWLPTVLFIPLLYAMGWIAATPLMLIGLPANQVSLTGTVLSFALFLLVLPSWAHLRWHCSKTWQTLGLRRSKTSGVSPSASFQQGLVLAVLLLTLVMVPLVLGQWAEWHWQGSWRLVMDALLLLFGVGAAEELIFRGWLWRELNRLFGPRFGMLGQAFIFSLVHARFNLGFFPMMGLLSGLFLLGLILALQRERDNGLLWGCIGLHGGLVSSWFLLEKGLFEFSPLTPAWLIGPGGIHPNPLGGAVAIGALTLIVLIHTCKAIKQ